MMIKHSYNNNNRAKSRQLLQVDIARLWAVPGLGLLVAVLGGGLRLAFTALDS